MAKSTFLIVVSLVLFLCSLPVSSTVFGETDTGIDVQAIEPQGVEDS
jgi:hypothetical protein